MQFQRFHRIQYEVEAVQVTDENINLLAEFIGNSVETTDTGNVYILANRKAINTHGSNRIFRGWWIVRKPDRTLVALRPGIFNNKFVSADVVHASCDVDGCSLTAIVSDGKDSWCIDHIPEDDLNGVINDIRPIN